MLPLILLAGLASLSSALPMPASPPGSIDESAILASPIAGDYRRWRDEFLQTTEGRRIWAGLREQPGFVLRILPLDPPWNGRWATVTRHYDHAGNYVAAEVHFSPLLGKTDVCQPVVYPHASSIARAHRRRDREKAMELYAFAHEIAHVLWGFDRNPAGTGGEETHADLARQFDEFASWQLRVAEEYRALSLRPRHELTATQLDRLEWLAGEDERLRRVEGSHWLLLSESYGDAVGHAIYRSWADSRRNPDPEQGLLGSR